LLQVSVKKYLVYGAVMFIWISMPAYVTTIGYVGTDIVEGTCVPWGVFGSYAAQVAVMSSAFVFTYLLPLMTMMYCYIRIVCKLRHKVNCCVYYCQHRTTMQIEGRRFAP